MNEMKINTTPVFAEERQQRILEILTRNRKIVVPELCNLFEVSASTIRNDLRTLEEAKLIRRTHGGAIIRSKVHLEPSPNTKETHMIKQKEAIAMAAANLVDDGDTIIISTGTTTFEFSRYLLSKKNLTIVLNDTRIAAFLEEYTDFSIFLIGGMIRNRFHYTYTTEASLPNIFIDKIFFSCNSLSYEGGATIPDLTLASNVKSLIKLSSESILLCDSSKVGSVSFAQIAPLKDLNRIIIDSDINSEDMHKIQQIDGCELIIAAVEN